MASLLFGCTVVSYTHYPTISNDMLDRVFLGHVMYNNDARFAQRGYWRTLKLWYYKVFAVLYGTCGYFARVVMVNSTWTFHHISTLFFRGSTCSLRIVYPPCGNSQHLSRFKLADREPIILSVGQFRPEKNHTLQIEAFYQFRKQCKGKFGDVRLIMVGGVRDVEDQKRVNKLNALIGKYDLREHVVIKKNLEWSQLLKLFGRAFVGLHTMEDEHFGICLAEYMVAGLVTIGHCSGGPLSDIVADGKHKSEVAEGMLQTARGFLCTTVEQYAECFETVFDGFEKGNGWMDMRTEARRHCMEKFSCETFQRSFVEMVQTAMN